MEFKDLEKIFYVNNNKITEVLWWNWSNRCGVIEYDIVTNNLSLKSSKGGTVLEDKDRLLVNTKKLFRTREKAEKYLQKKKPTKKETRKFMKEHNNDEYYVSKYYDIEEAEHILEFGK